MNACKIPVSVTELARLCGIDVATTPRAGPGDEGSGKVDSGGEGEQDGAAPTLAGQRPATGTKGSTAAAMHATGTCAVVKDRFGDLGFVGLAIVLPAGSR